MTKFIANRLALWALLLTMPLLVGSCKKGNDDVTPSAVEGNWKLTGMKFNPAVDTGIFGKIDDFYQVLFLGAGDCLTALTFTFNSTGTVALNNPPACQDMKRELSAALPISDSSRWTLNGNKLTLTKADGTAIIYDVTSSGNTMTWSAPQAFKNPDGSNATTTVTVTWTRA